MVTRKMIRFAKETVKHAYDTIFEEIGEKSVRQ